MQTPLLGSEKKRAYLLILKCLPQGLKRRKTAQNHHHLSTYKVISWLCQLLGTKGTPIWKRQVILGDRLCSPKMIRGRRRRPIMKKISRVIRKPSTYFHPRKSRILLVQALVLVASKDLGGTVWSMTHRESNWVFPKNSFDHLILTQLPLTTYQWIPKFIYRFSKSRDLFKT